MDETHIYARLSFIQDVLKGGSSSSVEVTKAGSGGTDTKRLPIFYCFLYAKIYSNYIIIMVKFKYACTCLVETGKYRDIA